MSVESKLGSSENNKEGPRSHSEVVKEALESHYFLEIKTFPARENDVRKDREEVLDVLRILPAEVVDLLRPPLQDLIPANMREAAMVYHGEAVRNTVSDFSHGKLRLYTGADKWVIQGEQLLGTKEPINRGTVPDYMIANALADQKSTVEWGGVPVSRRIIIAKGI